MKTYLFIIVSLFITTNLVSQEADPGVVSIAKEFYSLYKIPEGSYPAALFEKRKSKYFVVEQKLENSKIVLGKSNLFYDGFSFLSLEFPSAKNGDIDYTDHIDQYSLNQYALHGYYGYNGWYKDVINELEGKSIISNDELYSLARAYSASANALISNQMGDAVADEMFLLSFKLDALTSKQIEQYRSAIKKAITTFGKLAKSDSLYLTTVGKIGMKYANEIMVEFHTILTYSNASISQVEIPDNLYNDSVVAKVKAILLSCPKNAILTSFGDNDFYPFLYAQHKLKLRQDVYVINSNLLGMDRFIFRFSKPTFTSSAIKFSVDTSYYNGNTNDYFYLQSKKKNISFTDLIQVLNDQKIGGELKTLHGNKIIVPMHEGKKLEIPLDLRKQYMTKNEWVMIDLIKNLQGRKLCFQQPEFYDFPVLDNLLKKRGDVYVLEVK